MPEIKFTVTDERFNRIANALAGLNPIPEIELEVTEKTGRGKTKKTTVYKPEFTKKAWAKECVRRWIIKQVQRWEQKVEMEKAKKVSADDKLL